MKARPLPGRSGSGQTWPSRGIALHLSQQPRTSPCRTLEDFPNGIPYSWERQTIRCSGDEVRGSQLSGSDLGSAKVRCTSGNLRVRGRAHV